MIDRVRRSISNILAVAYRESLVLRHDKGFLATVISHPACWVVMQSDGTTWNTVSPYACSEKTYKPNSFKVPSS